MINRAKAMSPRPDFFRQERTSLNGVWEFSFDDKGCGMEEKWHQGHEFHQTIVVPFCYQSERSQIHDTNRHPYLWYRKQVMIPPEMAGKRVWLHFGAVDYEAMVWINGEYAGGHTGGHTSFSFEITSYINADRTAEIVVYVKDSYDIMQPRGKQHWNIQTDRCWYTATSGIWQDVWLEYTNGSRLEYSLITPDIDQKQVLVKVGFAEEIDAGQLAWQLTFAGELVKSGQLSISGSRESFCITMGNADPIDNLVYLWSPETPHLYDLTLILYRNGEMQDQVETYFGMRKIERRGDQILLNHYPLYQKLILDQGYWQESLMTAPDVQAYETDIELVKKMGFNGVRKHQKIEAPVFLYLADALGLLVWAEMPSNYEFGENGMTAMQKEYGEMILRDYNHPSIITWVPYNESWGVRDILWDKRQQSFALSLYYFTKALDDTRLVSTNDGWEAVTSDLTGIHDYESDSEVFYQKYKDRDRILGWTAVGKMLYANGFSYQGEPILMSEFGGIAFEDENEGNWGYNGKAKDTAEFLKRFAGLIEAIGRLDYLAGYCYTQLTDVEQETNGLLNQDRTLKVPLEEIRKIIE